MTMPLDHLEAEALKLSADERGLLVDRLVASIAGRLSYEEEWLAEAERRDAVIESGAATTVPLEEVLARVRRASG